MNLIKKLLKDKKHKEDIIEKYLLNNEAIPPNESKLDDCLNMNPEGEYILTKNGIYVCNPVVKKPKPARDEMRIEEENSNKL